MEKTISAKYIHVMQKQAGEFVRIKIVLNRVMSKSEYRQLQKQTADDYHVSQNMVGGCYNEI